ncbi:MAG: hypothetical protein GX913_00255 [Clostridiales bacterium]|nr:hypothetical protein [Clostridiales bacterium]
MDRRMDDIINQLSNIEATSVRIMNATDFRKKELVQEINEQTTEFDAKLSEDTNRTLDQARQSFNEQKDYDLSKLKSETAEAIIDLNNRYEAEHTNWAEEIFEQIIRT